MRRSPMKRGGRIKPVNRKRRASEFARCYGSKERVRFVKTLPCCAITFVPSHEGQIENAHIENAGSGRKANYDRVIPLCAYHHRRLHEMGRREFANLYFVRFDKVAAATEASWQAFLAGESVGLPSTEHEPNV